MLIFGFKGSLFLMRISNVNNAKFHVFDNKTVTMAQLHVTEHHQVQCILLHENMK